MTSCKYKHKMPFPKLFTNFLAQKNHSETILKVYLAQVAAGILHPREEASSKLVNYTVIHWVWSALPSNGQ